MNMADRERMSKRCAEEGCTWVYYYVPGSQGWERCKWCDSVRQGGEDVRRIHVGVSHKLFDKIVRAHKANGNTLEEWVCDACEESADYDINQDREREQRRKAVKP